MYQRILVPVDDSPTSSAALEEAIRLAGLTHARLRLVHVVDEQSFAMAADASAGCSGEYLEDLRAVGNALLVRLQAHARRAGLEVDTALYDSLSGTVHELVVNEACEWPADLIVAGTHGRRGVSRLVLGSSAESIVRLSPVPVLLVRAPEAKPDAEIAANPAGAVPAK